jgi:hypothetical protein
VQIRLRIILTVVTEIVLTSLWGSRGLYQRLIRVRTAASNPVFHSSQLWNVSFDRCNDCYCVCIRAIESIADFAGRVSNKILSDPAQCKQMLVLLAKTDRCCATITNQSKQVTSEVPAAMRYIEYVVCFECRFPWQYP